MTIQEYLQRHKKSFQDIEEQQSALFAEIFNNEKEKKWLVPIEDKLDKLSDVSTQEIFIYIINKLKSDSEFIEEDVSKLSVFVSKIDSIVNVSNWINNFKDDRELNLVSLFNRIKSADTLESFNVSLSQNLKKSKTHFFAVVKHCQNPDLYPIYYPFWQKINKHVLEIENSYVSMCEFYRSFPKEDRALKFGSYYGTLIKLVINDINNVSDISSKSKIVDFLKNKVINLKDYRDLLDATANINNNIMKKKYWIYSPGEKAYKWEELYSENIMALGWDDIGDLTQFATKNDIQTKLLSTYESNTNRNNDAIANFEFSQSVNIGDIVIVKNGRYELLGYGQVLSDYYFDDDRDDYKHCRRMQWNLYGNWKVDHTLVMKTLTDITTQASGLNDGKTYYDRLLSIMENTTVQIKDNPIKTLLEYKKQIILQGPPGTGKTRLAKQIASDLLTINNINKLFFKENLKAPFEFKPIGFEKDYKPLYIKSIVNDTINFKGTNSIPAFAFTFSELYNFFNSGMWVEQTFMNYEDYAKKAIIKYLLNLDRENTYKNQFKLIQFHPSYTYEDFVRGIVAETKGDKIEYKNVNKTLGLFAKEALANFKASKNDSPEANIESWIDEKFELFKNEIEAKLPEEEITLSGDITVFDVTDSHFKYAKSWNTPGYLKYVEFKKLIKAVIQKEFELSNKQLDKEKFIHAHYRYTYYNALLKLFFDEYTYEKESVKVKAKNYVLIIDEINRANLSSVLGELIYALEYRGEEVESMYEVDGSQKLILPPNLYIIGTMNTADRSVGHIDYAIRRRFAFVDVLPEDLSADTTVTFDSNLFAAVKALFTTDDYKTRSTCLSKEFEPKDVALGHSYFIDKSNEGGTMAIRLEYEIKPILLEYVKDGVLVGETILEEIAKLSASI